MAASKPRALWLRLRNTPILRMLRLEEALFRADKAHSWFVTNEWDGPAEAANANATAFPVPAAGTGVLCQGKQELVGKGGGSSGAEVPLVRAECLVATTMSLLR